MAENTYKKLEKEKSGTSNGRGLNKFVGIIRSLLNGSFLTIDRSPGLLPFLFFVAFIAIMLIANTYLAEKKARRVEGYRNEVTELRTIYISYKSELMYLSNQSEIARRLSNQGFVESTVPPRVLHKNNRRSNFLLRIFKTGN